MADKKNGRWMVTQGNPDLQGAVALEEGINFTIAAKQNSEVILCLIDRKGGLIQEIPMPANRSFGDVRSVVVHGMKCGDAGYRYEVDGKPYIHPCTGLLKEGISYVPSPDYDWEDTENPDIPVQDLMIYKLHVRGFTKGLKKGLKHKGTFAALAQMVPYIRDLGFNAVEIMPMYEWLDDLKVQPFTAATDLTGSVAKAEPLKNYWGYAEKNYYFAPKESFAAGNDAVKEVKDLILAFHKAGIAVIMEMYFPGGTNPHIVTSAIHYWKLSYQIDGFHLIGEGVPYDAVLHDPFLTGTYLLLEYVNGGQIYGRELPVRRNLLESNASFEHTGRALLKGDEGQTGEFARLIRLNPPTHGVVNYMASVNGFTLFDAVSYDRKHNEANGENNLDGTAYNLSWNCGVEGPSRRKAVRALRLRQVRNALLYTFLSQGTPLLLEGDECLNSQDGNNNAYASDNPTGWKSWGGGRDAEELTEFVRKLTAFRAAHPIFHMEKELRGTDYRSFGIPDVSFHDETAWACAFENTSRTLAVLLNGMYTLTGNLPEDEIFYVMYNALWEKHTFALPDLPKDYVWKTAVRTDAAAGEEFAEDTAPSLEDQKFFTAGARSVAVLRGVPGLPSEDVSGNGSERDDT